MRSASRLVCVALLSSATLMALAGATLAQQGAKGEEAKAPGVILGASFFSRYELRNNFNEVGLSGRRLGEGDGTVYRARLNLSSTPVDVGGGFAASVLFAPQAAGYWGDVSGGLTDLGLGTHEARLRIANDRVWVDVGRFEMVYGEHLIIGNVDWNEFGRSFDGARARVQLDDQGSYIDVFATQVAEGGAVNSTSPIGAGDTYFLGIYAGIGPHLAADLDLDVYSLFLVDPETDDGPVPDDDAATELTLGTRARYKVGPVRLRVEGGLQVGERITTDQSMLAWQVDADAAVAPTDSLGLALGGQYASGDDPTTDTFEGWNQLFPTAHKFLGLTDVIGARTNVASVFAKLRWKITDSWSFAADQHAFFRPEVAAGVDNYTGVETDLWGLWRLGRGLTVRAQYSLLVGNSDGPLGSAAAVHYAEAQVRLDF